MNPKYRHGLTVLSIACLFALTPQAGAQGVQGFEPGDPAVTAIGDASSQTTFQTVAPPEGLNQYLITTISTAAGDGETPVSGTNAVTDAALETFFFGTTLPGTQGSGFRFSFSTDGTPTDLSFQFDFFSNEPLVGVPKDDFAFVMLFDSSNVLVGSVQTIATVNTSVFTPAGPGGPFGLHTGYQTFTLSLASLPAGTYTLGIGIEDRGPGTANASGLLVDGIQLIPEPSTVGLGVAGAALLIALRSRMRKRVS